MNLFYALTDPLPPAVPVVTIDRRYRWYLWRPSLTCLVPPGMRRYPTGAAWWLLHQLRLYGCHDYSILVIYDGERLIHRSHVFPKWLRFPFMAREDLQIADTWTHDECRGQGLATFALAQIVAIHRQAGRCFWYLVHESNHASIHVAEKAGFRLVGKGSRVSRYGLRLLGYFRIEQWTNPTTGLS